MIEVVLERKKENSDVANDMNYGHASFFSWLKFIHDRKTCMTRIRGPPEDFCCCFFFVFLNVNTLNGCRQACRRLSPPLGSHTVG